MLYTQFMYSAEDSPTTSVASELALPKPRELYGKFGSDLVRLTDRFSDMLTDEERSGMRRQFDDLEANYLYLLLREYKPAEVVEISPRDGWSTMWILQALQDNQAGKLRSYDLDDSSMSFIPLELQEPWQFVHGNVKEKLDLVPDEINFLLIDCSHTRSFAKWYVTNIFPRVRPGAPVVVHDMATNSILPFTIPFTEESYVKKWLSEADIKPFTFNSASAEGFAANKVASFARAVVGIEAGFSQSTENPALFFRMPG